MPAESEKQKKFFGAVMGAKKGQTNVSDEAKKTAKEMPKKEIKKFLHTKEEDEQSISKKMKKGGGKAEFEGPKTKERKHFAPPSQEHKPEKGKGSYDRKKKLQENADIDAFIQCLLVKNYASANKYLNNAVESKLLRRIEEELETPLFQTYE